MENEKSGATMSDFMAGLEEHMRNTKTGMDIPYPIEVSAIKILGRLRPAEKVGSWVSIRPCDSEFNGKTFLGVYLGDMLNGAIESYNVKTKQVDVILSGNPAIYVPDLKKVIWGMESWWGIITSPEGLRAITDADIENVWYVRALKELSETPK